MAEESPSSVSITDEDVVRISKAQYRQAVTQMKQHKLQLVAASNLHRLMREKEEQLAASREENRQLQLALQQSDTRLGNIVRLQAATAATSLPAATHSLEADCANIVLQLPQSDVEEDSANVVQVQSRRKSDVETDSAPQSPHSVTNLTEKPTNKLDSVAVTRTPLTALPSASVTSSPVLESTDACASTHVTCSASSVTTQLTSISPTTTATNPESKDLLDKVLQQNARLKKILRDLLSQKGLSVSTYLVGYHIVKVAFRIACYGGIKSNPWNRRGICVIMLSCRRCQTCQYSVCTSNICEKQDGMTRWYDCCKMRLFLLISNACAVLIC